MVEGLQVKQVILNADDYGLCSQVTRAILTAHAAGIVSSTTVLANMCPAEDLRALVRSGLASGLHLNFVEGLPLTGTAGLGPIVDSSGCFSGLKGLGWAVLTGRATPERLMEEARAQANVLLEAGVTIDHIDSHQHTHHLPMVADAAAAMAQQLGGRRIRLAREPYGIGLTDCRSTCKKLLMRPFVTTTKRMFTTMGLAMPDHFFGIALMAPKDPAKIFRRLLRSLPNGLTEIALHLSVLDEFTAKQKFLRNWSRTLACLIEMDFPSELANLGVQVTTFRAALPAADSARDDVNAFGRARQCN